MPDDDLSIQPATPSDLDRVERLLAANDLPTADVTAEAPQFYLASHGGTLVGVGGLERYGADGLLRSVVVAEHHRGNGYGEAICDALAARARRAGVTTLYLVTTTAADYFRRRGYTAIDRSTVPEAIGATRQLAELCPDSATCMRAHL